MKNKRWIPLLLALLLLLFCSCEADGGDFGNEQTRPLERIREALLSGNAETYESAFPEDFLRIYRSNYEDIDSVVETLLHAGLERDTSAYGLDTALTFELLKSENYPVSALSAQVYYDNIDEFLYNLPIDSVEEARALEVEIVRKGSFGEKTSVLEFTALKIEGVWYLHPADFGTLLN